MPLWTTMVSYPSKDAWLLAFLLNAAIKSLLVLALAAGVCVLWRRASAATRHLVWFLALACLALLPIFSLTLPGRQQAFWSVSAGQVADNELSLKLDSLSDRHPETSDLPSFNGASSSEKKAPIKPTKALESHRKFTAQIDVNWLKLGVLAWGLGVMAILFSFVIGQFQLQKHRRNARQIRQGEWLALLAEASDALDLRRPITLLQSQDNVMPMTWGWLHPAVLLPVEGEEWPLARRRVVLLHELAHVRRRDCLTQSVAEIVCAFYWFNPLVWLALRGMRAERERACDDLVLKAGCKASDYAGHLVAIAEKFQLIPQSATIAMARPSGLKQRVEAILDVHRNRSHIARFALALLLAAFLGTSWLIGSRAAESLSPSWSFKNSAVAGQLKRFVTEKRAQEVSLLKADEAEFYELKSDGVDRGLSLLRPNCQPFFDAASQGDWLTTSNLWAELEANAFGKTKSTNGYPHGMWLNPIRETFGAVEAFVSGNGKYSEIFGNEVIQSIPPGSIYFGGTDPGRFIVTVMQQSHASGIPFFTLTQNALADGSYLNYLRSMFGETIYIPSREDSQRCFSTYAEDVRRRAESHRLKPGENVEIDQGRVQISGLAAVMEINGLLVKTMFDHNTNREFFVEESYPLDWMYPNLEPHGFIFKLNRQPLPKLSETMVNADNAFWKKWVSEMVGGWLNENTSISEIATFAEKVFDRHDLNGFTGDPGFVQNDYTSRIFSKLRSSVAGLYAWRAEHANIPAEKERMTRAADFAFRQALALHPNNPEVIERYTAFLRAHQREADAQQVQNLASHLQSAVEKNTAKTVFQMRQVQDQPSANTEAMAYESQVKSTNNHRPVEWLNVEKTVQLDQTALKSAQAIRGLQGDWQIEISFTDAGRKQFAEITRQLINQRLAIVIDGKLMTAPFIRAEISSGTAQIAGSFDENEARALAAKLDAAAQK